MKVIVFSLVALISLIGVHAFASQSCHPDATLSCAAQYNFASGSTAQGPTSSGSFQETSDGEGGSNCDAYASLQVPNTDIKLDASISDLGKEQMDFDLFVTEGDRFASSDFDQTGTNTYRSRVILAHPEKMMNDGKLEELAAITYDCALNEKTPKVEQISCQLLYDLEGPSDDDLDVPTHVQVIDYSDLYGYSVSVNKSQIVATLTDRHTGKKISQVTRLVDFLATPYMPQEVVSTSVGKNGLELVEVSCSPVRK
jgi:hypothetical protein